MMSAAPGSAPEIAYVDAADGRRLAYRHREGRGPTILFLPGYMSDMEGGKASALDAWAEREGRAMLRFDYAGCGASGGLFDEQRLADWRDDVVTMIDEMTKGPVLLVGSSMGGWLMLLAALSRPNRVLGLIGVAAAPDFTDWGFNDQQKAEIRRDGRLVEPSPYGDQPYLTTRTFWESGETLLLLGGRIPIDCPVRLLHGQADADVPWQISLKVAEQLRSANVQTTFVKDGDHRLSREQDIALLIRTAAELLEAS